MSREEKVKAAKIAFSSSSGYRRHVNSWKNDNKQPDNSVERKHRLGLWRFLVSVMLFFLLMAGFHYNISFKGIDREKIKSMLADDSKWNEISSEVSDIVSNVKKSSDVK